MTAYMQLFCVILASLFGLSRGDEWRNISYVSAVYQLTSNVQDVKMETVTETEQAKSLISCSLYCRELDRVSFYYIEHNTTCFCSADIDENANTNESAEIIYGFSTEVVYISFIKTANKQIFKKIHTVPEEQDCLALFEKGYTEDGVYSIHPVGGTNVDTWCDMSNGGWTVIQRRQDGSEDFYRTWNDYTDGFGYRTNEYWLGLEHIYKLTQSQSYLRIELETFGDISPTSAYALYTTFYIDNATSNYTLHVSGFSGDCGDSFTAQNGDPFTTLDRDNDNSSSNCAVSYRGAWWYGKCHLSNLNGYYYFGYHSSNADGINWEKCWGYHYSVKTSVMKVKRKLLNYIY